MTVYRILVASYTNEIVSLEFDTAKATLSPVSSLAVGHHPSWVASHPRDPSLVFTGLEQSEGKILGLKYDCSSGNGAIVSEASSGGQDPCSLLVADDELFIGNYSSGTVHILPTSTKSPLLGGPGYTLQFAGTGPNKSRQESSHPHQVILHPQYQELLVPDLGADIVRRFSKDAVTGRWQPAGHVGFESGGGPRHVAFYGEYPPSLLIISRTERDLLKIGPYYSPPTADGDLFTILELSNKVVRHKLPPLPALPKFVASTPAMSKPLPTPNDMLGAEILIPPTNSTFPTAYLYLSNRNDPSPQGDIISIYSIEKPNSLELITEIRTGLKHVRGMVFGGPDDRYLIAGGTQGGGVRIFERIDGGRSLKLFAEETSVEAPTGFLWLHV